MHEDTLYNNIKNVLVAEKSLDESSVSIRVKASGIVVLGGEVSSYTEKYKLESLILNNTDVKGIVEELKVNITTPVSRLDLDIMLDAVSELEAEIFVPQDKIKLIVENNSITLFGEVDYLYQRVYAQKALENVIVIVGITNKLVVKDKVLYSSEIVEKLNKELGYDNHNIAVRVHDNIVTLTGDIKNIEEYKAIIISVWSIPGVIEVIDNIVIG